MFDDDDWNVDDEYLKDFDFETNVECTADKNEPPKSNIFNTESSCSKKIPTTEKNELKTENQVSIDSWDVDDEDYFKDFDVDEVLENLTNKNNQTQKLSDKLKSQVTELIPHTSENNFPSNVCENLTSGVKSQNIDKISRRNAILDVFKNSNNSKKDSSNLFSTPHNDNNKSKFIKTDDVPSNKRKKSVAFSESVSEQTVVKRICVPSTSQESIRNISNVNNLKKKPLLEWLESPTRESLKAPKIKQAVIRKFPGPAGILPDEADENEIIDLDSFDENKNSKNSYNDVCSQNTKNLFTSGAWQLMIDDLPADFQLYDISVVKDNALEFSKTYQKVPYLAGIIQNIDHKPNDPHVVLKDLSGKIDARIHHSICKTYPNALGTNVVMLLKDVGVIVTSKKYVYVIVSSKSLVSAYSDDARLIKTPHLDKLLEKSGDVDLLLKQ